MTENKKQAYLDQAAAQLREWGATVDVIKAKLDKSAAGVRIELHTHIEHWNQKEPAFRKKLEELRAGGADGFESLKAGVQSAWNEVSTLMETLKEKQNDAKIQH